MKDKNTNTSQSSCLENPDYIKLQIEQMALCVEQQKRDVERSRVQVISDRIEQSRRNVEVILRGIGGFEKTGEIHNKLKSVLLENLEILREVKNIK